MKNLIKSIVFILIFCFIWQIVFKFLWVRENPIYDFYNEPKNSLDVVYVGSSNAYAHFNSTLAFNLYGFTTGFLSTDSQPFALVKYLIKESEKYQQPKLYIIDIYKLSDDLDEIHLTEGNIRRTTDSMKFSKNRTDAINDILSYKNVDKKDYINYYFSFLTYHNSWKSINGGNLIKNSTLYKGFLFREDTMKIVPQKVYNWQNNIVDLPMKNKQILMDLIQYIKLQNLNVLFVIPKRTFNEETNGRLNDATSIIKENELKVINFNLLEDFNIDFNTDLYNDSHLNVFGATKYTLYFSKYLNENYDLPSHKEDKKYITWSNEYNRFKNSYKSIFNTEFDNLLTNFQ